MTPAALSHSEILWQILSGVGVIVTVIAAHLRAQQQRKVTHEKVDRLTTAVEKRAADTAERGGP